MSPLIRGLLRPALSTTVVGVIAALTLFSGPSPETASTPARSTPSPAATPALTLTAAAVTTHRRHHRHHRHHHLSAAALAARGLRVLHVAQRQIGDRYAYGATGPSAFDCSGLTAYAYRVATGKHLPHNSSAQQHRTHRISARSARPGDLVFFHDGSHVYHVAIYAGHHTIVHAPYPGQRVKRERIWTSAVTNGRVI